MVEQSRKDVWTYASATSITTPGNVTGTYWPGMKVALKQVKYFVIESVTYSSPNTTIVLDGLGLYSLTSAAITAHIDVSEGVPKGFPYPNLAAQIKAAIKAYCDTLYVVRNGLTGGQTICGGTAAGDDLELRGSSHVTDGEIFLNCATVRIKDSGMIYCNDSNHQIFFDRPNNVLEFREYGDIWFSPGAIQAARTKTMRLFASGGCLIGAGSDPGANNLYVVGDVNCASVTDHTPGFVGDALAAITKISHNHKKEIDHSSLPDFVQSVYRDETGKEKVGRSMGGMISVLTVAVQQLIAENEKLAARIKILEA
jgi:hypothetical protein